jgi:hypothetical protein
MKGSLWVGTMSWLLLSPAASGLAEEPAGQGTGHERAIVVHVRNYAGVSDKVLSKARSRARVILERAGVETEWSDGTRVSFPNEVVLELLGRRQCATLAGSPDTLGLALLPKDGAIPAYAAVFLDRADALSRIGDASMAEVLGHAIAHEIGHLLLGTSEHSATGIMRARWSRDELRRAAWGQLLFTPEQSALLRAAAVNRRSPSDPRALLEVAAAADRR